MEIVKMGRIPEVKRIEMTCANCKTEFRFKLGEAIVINHQAKIVLCPLCGNEIHF